MSQLADINSDFAQALAKGVGTEEQMLQLKMDVLESLEWEDAAYDVADLMVSKGYKVHSWQLRENN